MKRNPTLQQRRRQNDTRCKTVRYPLIRCIKNAHESLFEPFDSSETRNTLHAQFWRGSSVLESTAKDDRHRRVVCATKCRVEARKIQKPGCYVEMYTTSASTQISTIGVIHASEHGLYLWEEHPKIHILAYASHTSLVVLCICSQLPCFNELSGPFLVVWSRVCPFVPVCGVKRQRRVLAREWR